MDEKDMKPKSKFCTNCGSPVFEGQVFCPNCGNKLIAPQENNEQPQNNWQQPQNNWQQPQNNWQQPQNAWQQPQNNWQQPQNAWQQSQDVQPEVVTPQVDDVLPEVEVPQVEDLQPEVEVSQSEDGQSETETPQPEYTTEPLGSWQQPQEQPQSQPYINQYEQQQQTDYYNQPDQQFDYGQSTQQQAYYGGQQAAPQQNAANPYDKPPKQPMDPKKKKKRIILFSSLGAGLLLLIVAGFFLLNYFSYTKLDASKICKITYDGVNGKGRITIELDEEQEDLKKALNDASDNGNAFDALKEIQALSSIDYDADKKTDLSNGDEITITANYDEDKLKEYKYKLTNTEFKVTVKGLKDADEIDLFKDITVNFNGVDGYGEANIDDSNADIFVYSYVRFSFKDNVENLKNGDTVTVVAEVSEDDLTDNGYTTDVFEKEYTVEGLTEVQAYDVFKDIKLDYEGYSPYISVSVNTDDCEDDIKNYVYFSIDDGSDKKIGDTITVRAEFDADYLRTLGYDITEDRKVFTIEAQGEYLSAYDDAATTTLDQAILGLIEEWSKENGDEYLFDDNVVSSVGEGYRVGEVKNEIINRYFAANPEDYVLNIYAVINKCTYTVVNDATGDTQTKEVYTLVTMSNVAKKADGTFDFVAPETYVNWTDPGRLIDALNQLGYNFVEVAAPQA